VAASIPVRDVALLTSALRAHAVDVAMSSVARTAPSRAQTRLPRTRRAVDGTRACAARATATKTHDDGFIAKAMEARVREALLADSDEVKALASARAPTNRMEEYRFTDFAALTGVKAFVSTRAEGGVDARGLTVGEACATCALVDGVMDGAQSTIEGATKAGVVIGMASVIGADRVMGEQSAVRGNVFSAMNSASAEDALVIRAPAGVKCAMPIHVATLSTGAKDGDVMRVSAPRMTIVVEENAELTVVEDFAGQGESAYWQNGVCEIVLEKGASLKHSIVQNHGRNAVHTRTTLVTQAEESKYEVNEISVGGKTARHDLSIKQLGPRTETVLGCFNLAGAGQTLDLHSKLQLDFEEGTSNQVHKCIVSAPSGKGVFDGNVQVNRFAQRTDAKQLSRNLLLVPKATVNVKPNLQIIADDVKCTHGCTVSDLEEEELFYIQSRGLSVETARSLLVSGFGVEVISRLPGKELRERVNSIVRAALERDRVQFEWTGEK